MLSKKEVRLVDYLLEKQGDFVSSAELAKALGVSDRTARKYVQQLSLSLE
ncbi:HTH domain-containing protein, partial [Streptococcus suis]